MPDADGSSHMAFSSQCGLLLVKVELNGQPSYLQSYA